MSTGEMDWLLLTFEAGGKRARGVCSIDDWGKPASFTINSSPIHRCNPQWSRAPQHTVVFTTRLCA